MKPKRLTDRSFSDINGTFSAVRGAPLLLNALKGIRELCYEPQAHRATETVLACIRIAEDAILEAEGKPDA